MRPSLLLTTALLSLLALAACGDGNGYGDSDDNVAPTATAIVATPTPFPTEAGADPVFWRTTDNFASLAAGTEYKVVFRITNGFAEQTLTVAADRIAGGQPIEFEGNLVTPVGGEASGSYYPVTILLPQPGAWELTVQAGADEVTIPVDVAEPGPASAG